MKIYKKLGIIALTLLTLILPAACGTGPKHYELSDDCGKSVSSFERKSGIKLADQGNGAYLSKDVVQVLAANNRVNSVTLLENAGKYTLFGAGIGMSEEAVTGLISDAFGKVAQKLDNKGNNTVSYSYIEGNRQLYITYDKDKKTVDQISYYSNSSDADIEKASGEMMLMVGDTKVYYNEAMAYLMLARDKYETDYGNGIWKADILGNGENFGVMIKQEVINQITELKVIAAEAEKQNTVLSEDEKADADAFAKKQFESIAETDRQQYHITQDLLRRVYSDNLLAGKMFEKLTINIDNNVSDEEAKQITVQDIFIQNYNLDSEGKKLALSSEDRSAAYAKVQALAESAKDTKDFKMLAEANSESKETEFTFGKGGAPKEFGEAFEKAAFALKTGETSTILSTNDGWHIIHCVSDFNEDATTQVKEKIIEQRRSDMFAKLYSQWSAGYEVVVNQEAWDAIPLGE